VIRLCCFSFVLLCSVHILGTHIFIVVPLYSLDAVVVVLLHNDATCVSVLYFKFLVCYVLYRSCIGLVFYHVMFFYDCFTINFTLLSCS
jgi:hypothetical protein